MRTLFFLLSALLLWASCRDRREPLQPASGNFIRFNDMQIGQSSRYVLFEGEDYYDPDNFDFVYRPDTLVLTVVGADANGFLIEEKMTPGSASRHGAGYIIDADSIYRYYFSVNDDTLFQKALPGPGAYLNHRLGYTTLELPLAQFTGPEIEIIGWKPDFMDGNFYWSAIDRDYQLFGVFYPDVNVLSDNRFMPPDGPGVWCAYTATNGLIKIATYNSWTRQGQGWDLLPD